MKQMLLVLTICISSIYACESCKISTGNPGRGGFSGVAAFGGNQKYKWAFDTSFEYRNYERIGTHAGHEIEEREREVHDLLDDWFVTQRIGYSLTSDFELGVSQGYRHLRLNNIEDEDALGRNETSSGIGDLELDFRWRFKHQKESGFPVDLALFGSAKFPTGEQHERNPDGEIFEAENQPGSGSFDFTIGLAASKGFGAWGSSSAISYTRKGEGTQNFKLGDVARFSVSASHETKIGSIRIYPSLGLQGLIEMKAQENGKKTPDHGGQYVFLVPGFAVKPIDRLTLGVSASIPIYQEFNGFHQKLDYTAQVGVGIRF